MYAKMIVIPLVVAFIVGAMAGPLDVVKFFGVKSTRNVTWAHAVNQKTNFHNNLNDTKIHMLEADVIVGKLLNPVKDNEIIMAHPPNISSDLSLEMFINTTVAHNNRNPKIKKGIKLDFKTDDALKKSYKLLDSLKNASFPVWINADILKSTNATQNPTVLLKTIIDTAAKYGNATLSLGWTTVENGNYTTKQVDEMLDFIKLNRIKNDITFPVRAKLAAESRDQMIKLINGNINNTLTIWSTNTDKINITNLKALLQRAGNNKVYLDLNSTILYQLDQY